ncbi:hypothetical protein QTP88_017426 [Uroleucon formosanum]
MKKIGTTRWNSKHHALQEIFHTTSTPNNDRYRYINLIKALHLLGYHEAVDSNTASDTRNLLEKWTNFEIILTSFIFLHIFEASTPVSAYLQTKNLDYIAAWNHISSLQEKMEKLATNFAEIYQKAKKKKRMDGELAIDELPTLSSVTNYKVTTFIPIMDQIKSTIQRRFSKCEDLMKSLAYLDPKRFVDINRGILLIDGDNHLLKRLTNLANVNHEKLIIELKDFAASFESLYLTINADLKKEKLYEVKKLSENDEDQKNQDEEDDFNSSNSENECKYCLPCVFRLLHKYNFHSSAYTNLYLTYKLILTLACTQVNCERSFSKLKIIETRLRASLGQELLEALLLISIEKDKIPNSERIISEFGKSSNLLSTKLLF